MWIKFIIILLFLFSVLQMPAAETKQKSQKDLKNIRKELQLEAASFNPKVPSLTTDRVSKIMLKEIYDPLLDKKLPKDVKHARKAEDIVTDLKLQSIRSTYSSLINNFELVEVTRIDMRWYKSYEAKLALFEPVVKSINIAVAARDQATYDTLRIKFESLQDSTKAFLDKKPSKISSDELKKIRSANTQTRIARFKKHQTEMWKELTGSSSSTSKKTTAKKSTAKKSTKKKSSKKR